MKCLIILVILSVALILLIRNVASLEAENIINGKIVKTQSFSDFSYVVSLRLGHGKNKEFVCGGALIAPNIVLTDAKCVYDLDKRKVNDQPYVVVAGTNDIIRKKGQSIAVSKIYCHADQQTIAVLRLKENFLTTDQSIRPISLPQRNEKFVGKSAKVVGFGASSVQGKLKDLNKYELRNAETVVIKSKLCDGHPDRLCTSGLTNGYGDRGSPLVYEDKVIGIVKYTNNDESIKEKVGIFTDVSSYVDFINGAVHDKPTKNTLVQLIDGYKYFEFPELNLEITTSSRKLIAELETITYDVYECKSKLPEPDKSKDKNWYAKLFVFNKNKKQDNQLKLKGKDFIMCIQEIFRKIVAFQNDTNEKFVMKNMYDAMDGQK